MLSFDQFINNRIGLGKAQYFTIFCLCLIDLNDGAELVLSSFLNPIIKQQLNLESFQVQILSSVFYLGILFGSLITGKFADNYGRKPVIFFGSSFQFTICCSFLFSKTYLQMVILRFFYGFSYGLTIALTTSMYSEIVPSKWRGKGLLLINFCVSIGKVYAVVLAYTFLNDFTSGNWRTMMFCSSFPSLIVVLGSHYKMNQSARFLLASGDFEHSFKILNQMIKQNNENNFIQITQQQKNSLKNWQHQNFSSIQKAQIKSLFNLQQRKITIALATSWFMINYMYYGQLIILPFIFGKNHVTFSSYAYTILGEAPSLLLSLFIIDRPNFGRKRSLTIFFCLAGVLHFIFCFQFITIVSSMSRFFMKQCFQMLYPFTTQSFGTLNRTLGFGFCSAIGRLGSFIMPYIIFPLLQIDKTLVFGSFVIVSALGAIASHQVPYDTAGTPLDQVNKRDEDPSKQNMIQLIQKKTRQDI